MLAVTFGGLALERLTASNYSTWVVKMQSLLVREDLWEAVRVPLADGASDAERRANDKAKATILLCVDNTQLAYVSGLDTAFECWQKFKDVYRASTASMKIILTRQLYNLKLQRGEDVVAHIDKLRSLFVELHEREMTFTASHQACVLLSSLDASWDTFVYSMQNVPESELSLDFVSARLMEQEKRNVFLKETVPARHVHSKPSHQSGSACIVRRCFGCGASNHLLKNCPHRNRHRAGRGGSSQQRDNGTAGVLAAFGTEEGGAKPPVWVMDSGCTEHCVNNIKLLRNIRKSTINSVTLTNGSKVKCSVQGDVFVPCLNKKLQNVLYVKSLDYCLLSISSLCAQGYQVCFDAKECNISLKGTHCAKGKLVNKIYQFGNGDKVLKLQGTENTPLHDNCLHYFHRVLGHLSFKAIRKLTEVSDLKLKPCNKFLDCAICSKEKVKRFAIPKMSNRQTTRPFELVHTDLAGPFCKSLGNATYVLVLVDDYTRFTYCYFLKNKSQAGEKIIEWVKMVERTFNHKVGCFQSDRGGEFTGTKFEQWLRNVGIRHQTTNPYSPEENGVAERKIGVLKVMKNCMLRDANVGERYWAEAINMAVHILNRSWSSVVNETPYFILYNRKPIIHYFRRFGSFANVLIPIQQRAKNQRKWRKLRFLGFAEQTKGYRFDLGNGKILISRSANFEKHKGWAEVHQNTEVFLPLHHCYKKPDLAEPRQDVTPVKVKTEVIEDECQSEASVEEEQADEVVAVEQTDLDVSTPVPRRSQRSNIGVPPDRFRVQCVQTVFPHEGVELHQENAEPQTYKDVMRCEPTEKRNWRQAMDTEYKSLLELGVFEVVREPVNVHTVMSYV